MHSKEKAPLGELIELCDVALSLIHERGKLLKLLRANTVREESDNVFNTALKRLQHLERISHQVHLALRNPVSVKDSGGWVKTVREKKLGALILNRPTAVRQQRARTIVYRDGEPASHDAAR